MLGFSVYLQEDWTPEKERYVQQMANAGFEGAFTSLHIPEEDGSLYKQRLQPLLEIVRARGLKLLADVSGEALKQIGLSFQDPKAIYESGFTGIRIDDGVDVETIANLSHYLLVGLNASTLTEADYEQLIQYGADFRNMEAWHNYYPRPDTGLDEGWFYQRNTWLKKKGFQVCAFAPGDNHLRLPLYETLPTLEIDRHQHPLVSCLALKWDYLVDDVYIGDPGLTTETYEQFSEYLQQGTLLMHAESVRPAWDVYIYGNHQNRLDVARDVVRSERSRGLNGNDTIEPENTVLRQKGDITIDNERYKRYKGELQIVRNKLSRNANVNVIGQVIGRDLAIIDYIQSGTPFRLRSPTSRRKQDGLK